MPQRKTDPTQRLILGLDLGPSAAAWALIKSGADGEESLTGLGVRYFPEGVDNFDTSKEVSRNEARRIARGMRRQIARRRRRINAMRTALVEAGLFPADTDAQRALLALDPYELRTKALSDHLPLHHLGRVILHLSKRRGFLSNRRKDRADSELKGMLAEINELEAEREQEGLPTLGALLHKKATELSHRRRQKNDHVRNRHTARAMFESEFEAIWEAQSRLGHADLLTNELKYGQAGPQKYPCKPRPRPDGQTLLQSYGIHGILFFQRKMFWPKSLVGTCKLEPRQPRCAVADRQAQRFRLLQEVNNLRYLDPDQRTEEPLSPAQRKKLLEQLSTREHMTFEQIRRALGFTDAVRFNLERGKRPRMQGHETDALIAKSIGKSWYERPNEERDRIVRAMLDSDLDDEQFLEKITKEFGCSASGAEQLLQVDLRRGYSHVSLKAIERLLPHLEKGLIYQSVSDPKQSALHAAGYLRRDELQRRLFGSLPDPERTANSPLADVPNPVVKRTLTEVRKVINAIIREYGRPDEVHIEMGRDVKVRPKPGTRAFYKYQDKLDEMREREAQRNAAVGVLRDKEVEISRKNILKYLLWQQQDGACVYSGQAIGFNQLFGHDIEIDHILPWSRSLDDSQMNKVICFRQSKDKLGNHDKGDRTPYEWLGEQRTADYEGICQRAKKLPYPKYRRFLLKELKLDDFVQRQLNDTRYITKLTGEYLRCLVQNDHDILGLKGELTADLRRRWGLETLLSEIADSPAWDEQAKLTTGEKNRADLRHHAIDALVVALTDRSRLDALSRIRHADDDRGADERLAEPWDNFRESVKEALIQTKITRRAERKVAGGLHEDTLYGKTPVAGEWIVRKPLESLSPNEIERIRDPAIRDIVIARLGQHDIEFGRGKKPDAKKWKQALTDMFMPSGVPIKKVRVIKPELTVQEIRSGKDGETYVKPGSTHHICIFEWSDGKSTKREAVFVTMLDAMNRIKRRLAIVNRIHPARPDAKFIMSLSRGEYVLADWKGQEKLLAFRTAASTQGQLYFIEHSDGRKGDDAKKYVFKASTLKARKVTVDPLGRIRWAND